MAILTPLTSTSTSTSPGEITRVDTYQSPSGTTPDPLPPEGTLGATNTPDGKQLRSYMEATFPWLKQLGLPLEWYRDTAIEALTDDEIVSRLRQQPAYKQRFAGIYRADGTLRSNEAEYLRTEDSYVQLLKRYGKWTQDMEQNRGQNLAAFFMSDIDPNELNDRLQIWDQIDKGGQDVKDAFYVYAGLTVTTEDLYQAAVDPGAHARLVQQYDQAVAINPADYQTWITRATEVGMARVAQLTATLEQNGVLTKGNISDLLASSPEAARTLMDQLYHGGDAGTATRFLDLAELTRAFEYAMIGSAATQNGLALPTKERLAAMRQAGIDRAAALKNYSAFATNKNLLDSSVRRLNMPEAQGFDQNDFEKAVFLQSAREQDLLQRAAGLEESLGKTQGTVGFSRDNAGRLVQTGLRA